MRDFVEVKLNGFDELEKALKSLPTVVADRALRSAAVKAANVIRDQARANVPVRSEGGPKKLSKKNPQTRQPGNLKRSIVARVNKYSKYDVRVDVGPNKGGYYGHMVELGTKHHGPHPYLRPALHEKRTDAVRKFGEQLAKNIAAQTRKVGRKINLRYLTRGY